MQKKVALMLDSNYSCEQLFSTINLTKKKPRSRVIDDHLENALFLASFNLSTKIYWLNSIRKKKQANGQTGEHYFDPYYGRYTVWPQAVDFFGVH